MYVYVIRSFVLGDYAKIDDDDDDDDGDDDDDDDPDLPANPHKVKRAFTVHRYILQYTMIL